MCHSGNFDDYWESLCGIHNLLPCHYTPNSRNSLEYWIDIDEQDYYGNLSLITPGPFYVNQSVAINTSQLINQADPLYPVSFALFSSPDFYDRQRPVLLIMKNVSLAKNGNTTSWIIMHTGGVEF